jgi:signal transduction histidine kinase
MKAESNQFAQSGQRETAISRRKEFVMRLVEFIRTHTDEILAEWEEFAKTLTPFGAELSPPTLRDHLPKILQTIADDMAPSLTPAELERSKSGWAGGEALDQITAAHAAMRFESGFDLEHTIAEYRALRGRILRLWLLSQPVPEENNLDEVTRFNEIMDQAIADVIRQFAGNATRYSDRFVGILVHDLRGPLNLINVAAYQLLEAGPLDDRQTASVSRIFRGVRRMDRLINDLAVLVRSRAGLPLPLAKAEVDLGQICEDALDEVRVSHADTVFDLRKNGDLVGNWDGERLAQVVSNLAVNAIVHASAKEVAVLVQGEGADVLVKVRNYGTPIPAEMLEPIFDPLVRQNQTLSHELSSGLGLGLFIVRAIVKAHGGSVQVSSSQTDGTTFTVRLPRNAK